MSVVSTKDLVTVEVGREDYSQNIEYAVEPVIRSWESEYRHNEAVVVGAGEDTVSEISIEAETVVLIYDIFLSTPRNVLLNLLVEAYIGDGVWGHMAQKSGYQTLKIPLSRGFPLFDKYRITVTNFGSMDITCYFSSHGIVTAEKTYYARAGVPP